MLIRTTTSVMTYDPYSTSITYTGGWSQNGTYMQSRSGSYNGIGTDSRTFKLNFDGPAIWIWGFCGPTDVSNNFDYGWLTINGVGMYDCLVYLTRLLICIQFIAVLGSLLKTGDYGHRIPNALPGS
jgi:hypothetical protein